MPNLAPSILPEFRKLCPEWAAIIEANKIPFGWNVPKPSRSIYDHATCVVGEIHGGGSYVHHGTPEYCQICEDIAVMFIAIEGESVIENNETENGYYKVKEDTFNKLQQELITHVKGAHPSIAVKLVN